MRLFPLLRLELRTIIIERRQCLPFEPDFIAARKISRPLQRRRCRALSCPSELRETFMAELGPGSSDASTSRFFCLSSVPACARIMPRHSASVRTTTPSSVSSYVLDACPWRQKRLGRFRRYFLSNASINVIVQATRKKIRRAHHCFALASLAPSEDMVKNVPLNSKVFPANS